MLYECDRFCNIRIFLNSISILLLCSIFVALFSSQGSHNSSFQANRLIGHTVPVNETSLIVDTISLYHLPTQTCFWTIEGLSLKCCYECTNIPLSHYASTSRRAALCPLPFNLPRSTSRSRSRCAVLSVTPVNCRYIPFVINPCS